MFSSEPGSGCSLAPSRLRTQALRCPVQPCVGLVASADCAPLGSAAPWSRRQCVVVVTVEVSPAPSLLLISVEKSASPGDIRLELQSLAGHDPPSSLPVDPWSPSSLQSPADADTPPTASSSSLLPPPCRSPLLPGLLREGAPPGRSCCSSFKALSTIAGFGWWVSDAGAPFLGMYSMRKPHTAQFVHWPHLLDWGFALLWFPMQGHWWLLALGSRRSAVTVLSKSR